MSKPDYVKDEIYSKHLFGDARRYMPNPAAGRESAIERFYHRRLTELCMNRFKWSGLPDSVDTRYLEMQLFYRALAVVYHDERYDVLMAMQATPAGKTNPTQNPTAFKITGVNFPSVTLKAKDCVPVWANMLRVPDLDIMLIYAKRLAELDRTIEINAKNARRTKVLVTDHNARLTATNINRQIDNGESVIEVSSQLGGLEGMLTTVDLGVNPDSIEKLHILKVRIWNECMMHMGIDGANQDKKERLVADEVHANAAQVDLNKAIALNQRQLAAEQINRKYGLNVTVEYNTDIDSAAELFDMFDDLDESGV